MDEFGLEGYGAYWLLLEAIAEQCDDSDNVTISMSPQNWRKVLPFYPQRLAKFAQCLGNLQLFSVEVSKSLITISCPKLLKYRDEYTERKIRKSGVCREKVLPRSDIDQNKEEKNKDNTPLTPDRGEESAEKPKRERKSKGESSLPFEEAFADFWGAYPRKTAKANAEKAWAKLAKSNSLPDMDTLLAAISSQAEKNDWAREDGRFCPHPATWLNGRRWEDTPGIAKPAPPTDLRKYRSWAESYATKRAALIGGTAETTSDVLDSGAKVLAEYITPDGFSEDEAGRIISWILAKPERAAHVSALANLADEVPGWGMLITWASNGSRGMDVGDDPRTWRKAANG
jgi:hypothetical protein